MTAPLHPFEGRSVIATRAALTNAGDGLSQAMSIDAAELEIDDEVFIVYAGTVTAVTYQAVKDNPDMLIRVHKIKAGTATMVDKALVEDVIAEQRRKINEAKGVDELNFGDGDTPGEGGDSDGGYNDH